MVQERGLDCMSRELSDKAEAVLRRFGGVTFSGRELTEIRSLVGMTQSDLASEWGISRTMVSRMESGASPSAKVSDQYRGLLMRKFFFEDLGE